MRKLPTRDALVEEAKRLGVSLGALYSAEGIADEPELQRRVLEARRARRDGWLWLFALLSAVAAALSAAAAWLAVLWRQ